MPMHYYQFNIGDWTLGTSHLSLEEEAIYLRLVNHYYSEEKPIPLETERVMRRLRLGSDSVIVCDILHEFFVQTDKGWLHNRCEEMLKTYRKTVKKNRENGKKGGRPRKDAGSSETQNKPTGNPVESEREPTGNPNQEPLTINQEPLTKPKDLSAKPTNDVFEIFTFWRDTMKKTGTTKLSAERKRKIEARLKDGYSTGELKQAILNCSNTSHNMGYNDRNKKFNDIELIFRDCKNTEGFRDNPGDMINGRPQGGQHETSRGISQQSGGPMSAVDRVRQANAHLFDTQPEEREVYGDTLGAHD